MDYRGNPREVEENKMLAEQTSTQANRAMRSKKLSPELNEFLHMLDALEGQTGGQDAVAAQSR
jgi:hypothetical protein